MVVRQLILVQLVWQRKAGGEGKWWCLITWVHDLLYCIQTTLLKNILKINQNGLTLAARRSLTLFGGSDSSTETWEGTTGWTIGDPLPQVWSGLMYKGQIYSKPSSC